MKIDIVIVLYNSARWLSNCIKALSNSQFDLQSLHLIFVDNASTDETLAKLADLQQKYQCFGGFTIAKNAKNGGFAKGCNQGAMLGTSSYLLFLNGDTEVFPLMFSELQTAVENADDTVAAFECRQLPFETGHHVDPVTLYTNWASGAALLVRRDAFILVNGFDEHLFMYCEDVDLSWRLRSAGFFLQYVPKAQVNHYAYEGNDQPEQKLGEYAGSYLGNLLLRYKFGSLGEITQGHKMYLRTLRYPVHFPRVRKVLARNYFFHFFKLWPFVLWRFKNKKLFRQRTAQFEGGFSPDRGLFRLEQQDLNVLVSVIIRTCGRPFVLEKTLTSLCHQTYSNFEVIIVEDGKEESRKIVEAFSGRLTIRYFATGQKVGRSKAGNFGLSQAKGAYCNFLDDDDFFYPDHLELLLTIALRNPQADLITAASMAIAADVLSKEPYEVDVASITPIRFNRINVFTLCQQCQMPIQSILFKRELFEKYGGLNENLDGDEDWSMWLQYFSVAKRVNPTGLDSTRATSLFMVPANKQDAIRREQEYKQYEQQMLEDDSIQFTVTPKQMREFYNGTMADFAHLYGQNKLEEYFERHASQNIVE